MKIYDIDGDLLFESEHDTLIETAEEAVRQGANLARAYLEGANLARAYLEGADLRRADLRGAYFTGAYLRGADFRGAYLEGADLRGADLRRADLRGADFRRAYLRGADLRRANLARAYLEGADLRRADLRGADFRRAYLRGADFRGADLPDYQICPEEGSFIGWKKGSGNILIKIEICEDAQRSSTLIGRKCRASKVRVLEAWDKDGKELEEGTEIQNWNTNYPFTYIVGEIAESEYNDDIRVECTQGIHFFMTRKEAEEWG